MLAGMFSSSSSSVISKRSAEIAFDPNEDSLSAFSKQKKNKFRCKPSNVTVVVLAEFKRNIPRGRRRDQLRDAGRVKIIQFQRSMSAKQVANSIKQGFKAIKLSSWTYCSSTSYGMLDASESQELTGEDIVLKYVKSSLYLCESEVPFKDVSS